MLENEGMFDCGKLSCGLLRTPLVDRELNKKKMYLHNSWKHLPSVQLLDNKLEDKKIIII
jgi:hypothetical protein